LWARVGDVVRAIESAHGRAADIRCAPDPLIERHFGRYPGLTTPDARALGFVDDGSLCDLSRSATESDR